MRLVVRSVLLMLLVAALARAQDAKRHLSASEIEKLLRAGVSQGRVADLVDQRGIDFDITSAIKQQLRDAGANAEVIAAVDRASLRAEREKLEAERRKDEGRTENPRADERSRSNDKDAIATRPASKASPNVNEAKRARVAKPDPEDADKRSEASNVISPPTQAEYLTDMNLLCTKYSKLPPEPNKAPNWTEFANRLETFVTAEQGYLRGVVNSRPPQEAKALHSEAVGAISYFNKTCVDVYRQMIRAARAEASAGRQYDARSREMLSQKFQEAMKQCETAGNRLSVALTALGIPLCKGLG